ncbi:MAG: tetraacyldisaccharide 4'-kinase, partial [Flavobacteriaceae bacterium]|nr:tetraacyldisaccharide 4'-kinase [Flavobacteriaceae bacterium]
YANLYSEDYFLPTGNLRDSRREARRADSIIVTKCPDILAPEQEEEVVRKLKPGPAQEVIFARLQYSEHLSGAKPLSLQELKEYPFTLVTGIAQPKPLVKFLKSRDLKFTHLAFPDHHHFSKKEIEKFKSIDLLVFTEKDYARVGHLLPNASFLEVKHKFLGEGKAKIMDCLGIKTQNASI